MLLSSLKAERTLGSECHNRCQHRSVFFKKFDAYLAILCIEDGYLRRSKVHEFALIEGHTSRYVYVKQMQFSVLSHDVSLTIETQACVEYLLLTCYFFWETATHDVLIERFGKATQHARCLTLLVGFVVSSEWLFVLEHVQLGIRSCEHLWQHYDVCPVLSGFLFTIIKFGFIYPDHLLSAT